MKKIYIGSKFKNANKVNELTNAFEKLDVINAYNWAANIKKKETKEDLIDFAKKEMNAIKDADDVIFLLPLGKGSHIELGMALAYNKKIYLVSNDKNDFDNNTVNFYEMDGIKKVVVSDEKLISSIIDCVTEK